MTTATETNIDSTIEDIEQHVDDISLSSVSIAINRWIKTLRENGTFKEIVSDLEALKEAIYEKNGQRIVELMTSLGEQTKAAAEQAKDENAKGLKKLGKALISTAKTINKLV